MSYRTLVITLGQLRAHELTWLTFKNNVLDQLHADLAVCVPHDSFFEFTNPFYVNARFRWLIPADSDSGFTFDQIQQLKGVTENWRILCNIPGSWIGGISESKQSGAGAIEIVLRWFMLDNVRAARLTAEYDRFVITRSDFYFLCPHPPLDCLDDKHLWIPNGEDHGGLCSRHLVVSPSHLESSCNLIDDLLLRPGDMHQSMITSEFWNIEKLMALHLTRNGLISAVKRFPYVMFLVRTPDDPTGTGLGIYNPKIKMIVKYQSEFNEADRYRTLITSAEDWRAYFSSLYYADLLYSHIYTQHGTRIYVDESTGALRHGSLVDSPQNVFFFGAGSFGRFFHYSADRLFSVARSPDQSTFFSTFRTGEGACGDGEPFEQVPISRGFALNETLMTNNLTGLRIGETYLSAEPDGRLTLSRSHCRKWEHFRLLPDFRWKHLTSSQMRTLMTHDSE